jgi:hypothetical protein
VGSTLPSTTIAEPRPVPEAEKERLPTLIASRRLHGGVVDDFHGAPERLSKVKSNPRWREIIRFGNRPVPENRPRVANRQRLILPIRSQLLHSGDHASRRHGGARDKLASIGLASGEDFGMCPADIKQTAGSIAGLRGTSLRSDLQVSFLRAPMAAFNELLPS